MCKPANAGDSGPSIRRACTVVPSSESTVAHFVGSVLDGAVPWGLRPRLYAFACFAGFRNLFYGLPSYQEIVQRVVHRLKRIRAEQDWLETRRVIFLTRRSLEVKRTQFSVVHLF